MRTQILYIVYAFLLVACSSNDEKAPKVFYVSPSGNTHNLGTENSPWSLAKANSSLKAGETAILLDGTYKVPISPVNSGEQEAFIIYRSKNKHKAIFNQINKLPDSLGTAVISLYDKSFIAIEGIKASNVDRWLLSYRSNHITINDCFFTEGLGWSNCRFKSAGDGMRITNNYFNGGTDLLSIDGGSNHLIEGNFFGDATHTGLVLLGVQRSVVRNNTLTNRLWRCMEVESQRHEPFQRSFYNLIEKNHFGYSPSSSIQYAGSNSIIRNNVFERSLGGMTWSNYLGKAKNPEAWHNEHNRFYNNLITECGSNEIVLNLIEVNKSKGYKVAETVRENGFGMEYLTNLFNPAQEGYTNVAYGDNVVINNIFYKNANILHEKASSTVQISFDWNATPQFAKIISNNIYSKVENADAFYFTDAALMEKPHKSNATIQEFEQYYPEWVSNNIEENPQFKDFEKGDYRLKNESSSIDKGIALTHIISKGSGRIIPVKDALFFTNGYGLVDADIIRINTERVTIRSIDYKDNTITIDKELSWNLGDEIFFNYEGEAPDLGVFEKGVERIIGADGKFKISKNPTSFDAN